MPRVDEIPVHRTEPPVTTISSTERETGILNLNTRLVARCVRRAAIIRMINVATFA
jgi:hypothetical protein